MQSKICGVHAGFHLQRILLSPVNLDIDRHSEDGQSASTINYADVIPASPDPRS